MACRSRKRARKAEDHTVSDKAPTVKNASGSTVYAVFYQEWDTSEIICVAASKRQADRFVKKLRKSHNYEVIKFTVGDMPKVTKKGIISCK